MKNTTKTLAAVLMMTAFTTIANANTNTNIKADEKVKATVINTSLPASLPALESPAPQGEKKAVETNKQTPAYKAGVVGLSFKSGSVK